jgi:hypothetical protein
LKKRKVPETIDLKGENNLFGRRRDFTLVGKH